MATRNSDLTAGTASAGAGAAGKRGRFGLRATLAAGVATLGCAAALLLGGARAEHAARVQPQPAPAAVQRPAGTDDLDTNRCIGSTGPFACAASRSRAGTDDLATSCVGTVGPFACQVARPAATAGTDDLATSWCAQTPGPFACAPVAPATAADHGADSPQGGPPR